MTVLRRFARPMLASVFIIDGLDAVKNPDAHKEEMERFQPVIRKVSARLGLSGIPEDPRLLARITGAVTLVAALALATGKAPRLAAFTLAAVTAKKTVVRYPVWSAQGPLQRREFIDGALRSASLVGGLLIAGADTEGKPSIGWRVRHAREARAAATGD